MSTPSDKETSRHAVALTLRSQSLMALVEEQFRNAFRADANGEKPETDRSEERAARNQEDA